MVQKSSIFSGCCGGCGILIFIIALATPWFYMSSNLKVDAADLDCTSTILYSWETYTCSTNDDTYCACPDDGNWRDECSDSGGDCKELEQTFDTAGAFVGLGFAVFVVAFAVVIIVNILGKGPAVGSKLAILLFGVALILTLIAVIQFPSQFPDAYDQTYDCPDEDSSPCKTFAGSVKYESSGIHYTISWGSGGWGMALAAVLICIINIVAAFVGKRK